MKFVPDIPGIIQVEIPSFSFKDYLVRMLTPQNIYLPELKERSIERLTRLMQSDYTKLLLPYLEGYLIYGGYPAVVREYTTQKRPEILRQIYQDTTDEILAFAEKLTQPARGGSEEKHQGRLR